MRWAPARARRAAVARAARRRCSGLCRAALAAPRAWALRARLGSSCRLRCALKCASYRATQELRLERVAGERPRALGGPGAGSHEAGSRGRPVDQRGFDFGEAPRPGCDTAGADAGRANEPAFDPQHHGDGYDRELEARTVANLLEDKP